MKHLIKVNKRRQSSRYGVFAVNTEQFLHAFQMYLLMVLHVNIQMG